MPVSASSRPKRAASPRSDLVAVEHELGAALDHRAAGLVRPHAAADAVARLEHEDVDAAVRELGGGGQAGEPGSDDDGLAHAARTIGQAPSPAACCPAGGQLPSGGREPRSSSFGDRLRRVPHRDVAGAGERDAADGGGRCAGRRDEAVVLGPAERDRHADVLEAGEAPGAHRAVDRLEARRVGVGADEPQRSLGRHARRRSATVPASATRRPAGLRTSAGSSGRTARARPRATPRLGASGSGHSPAGAIAVTDRAWPAAASSSATQPPSELPGHVVRAAGQAGSPRRPRRARRASAGRRR